MTDPNDESSYPPTGAWIADARSCDGKRFIVHADEKLSAFVELESAEPRKTAEGLK